MKMTDEHIEKMKAGRKALKIVSADSSIAFLKDVELQEVKKVSECLSSATGVFRKAFSGQSKAAAIKARCIQCCCYQKTEITLCRVTDCALFRYRPYQNGAEEVQDD